MATRAYFCRWLALGLGLQAGSGMEDSMKLIGILAPAVFAIACAPSDPAVTARARTQFAAAEVVKARNSDVDTTPFEAAVTDAGITTKVKTRLLADPRVNGPRIDVDTRDRIVTLTGIVNTAAEKSRALAHAAKVENVTGVEDRLTVRPR